MKKIYGYLGAFYLGFSLNVFAGLNPLNWQLYAIIIPVVILFTIDKYEDK